MSGEYISRKAAYNAIVNNYDTDDQLRDLDAIPAAEVVEVVRCGQCKYCVEHYDTDGNAPYWTCKEWDSGTDYDGYCHYGKRKDGGQDDD